MSPLKDKSEGKRRKCDDDFSGWRERKMDGEINLKRTGLELDGGNGVMIPVA